MRVTWWHVLVWAAVLGYFTCSATPFLFHLSGFTFQGHPRFKQLFMMDFAFSNPIYTISKIGHFLGFMGLDLLLSLRLKRPIPALVLAILFGVSTEFLQLMFNRDGRLYDIVIDGLGAFISYRFIAPHLKHRN